MSELIKAIESVKDPFTFLAFVSVVLLLAFRTRAVPDLFFGLLKEKLTKERFSQHLHRFMLFGFISFVGLSAMAVLGHTLAYKTQPKPMSSEEFKAEMDNLKSSSKHDAEALEQALQAYEQGIMHIDRKEFDQAIQSLQESINRAPTVSGQYTLAYAYKEKGDPGQAKEHATAASALAQSRGSALDVVKADSLVEELDSERRAAHGGLVNEASPEEGGEPLAASNPQLVLLLNGKLEEVTTDPGSELVIGFMNRQSALIEGCAWWIGGTYGGNLKDFELLVSNESPTSGFKPVGKFTTQNIMMLKEPFQEFRFSPVRARFVKWRSLSNFGGSNMGHTYGRGLRIYGKF